MKSGYELCYTDTGGTFTDTFIVDSNGDFILGKAPTTPHDVSQGYFRSLRNAIRGHGLELEDLFPQLQVVGYGATTVINTVVTRTGLRLGLLITKGFEDYLLMERGLQTFEGYSLPDRLHAVTHVHNDPLIPRQLVRGVTERIDLFGAPIIPLYEHEAAAAVEELLAEGVQGIVICFLYSYQNRSHEDRAAEIARGIIRRHGLEVPVLLSVDINPVMREYSRLNSTVIEGYAGHPARKPLIEINRRIRELGYRKGDLQILLSHGGLASVEHTKMVETVESGPVGGIMGARYIGEIYGFKNLLATDVGGTTFDVGMIRDGEVTINREPTCARFRLGIPMVEVDSIGAGGGTYVRLDPVSGRIEIGPDSAGASPGPICYDLGNEVPTITDVDFILGYLNPRYFLGGAMQVNVEKAHRLFREKIADPLGLDVLRAAEGVKEIFDTRVKGAINAMLMGKGYNCGEYHLLSYGGAGPTHVSGYTRGMQFKGVLVFPYSSVFSAFGASACPYEHHYHRAATLLIPERAPADWKTAVGGQLNRFWEELEEKGVREMQKEGYRAEQIERKQIAMVRYGNQLDDLPIVSPTARIRSAEELDRLIASFEETYSRIYTMAARFPQAGYLILEVAVVCSVRKPKPVLRKLPLGPETPGPDCLKEKRRAVFAGVLRDVSVYEMDRLRPGNRLRGPALVEHPTTTLVVPSDRSVTVDEYRTLWLGEA
ncbi:MAG: hydantoinase/oxoprolinase family protein [bacterium]